MSTSARRADQRGLGLLEALAALSILAASSAILYSWISQSVVRLNVYSEMEESSLARKEALDYLRSLNIAKQPKGSVQFTRFRMRWSSKPAEMQRPLRNEGGQYRMYSVGLFDVTVACEREEGKPWFDFELKLIGTTENVLAKGSAL